MSYRGRPSKGCEPCRARKVKCDETKPVCSRCSKSGHDCKYRDQADILFRNQTASAAHRAEESWRKRSKSQQSQQRAPSESSNSNNTPPSDQSSPPSTSQLSTSESRQNSQPSSSGFMIGQGYQVAGAASNPHLGHYTITPEVQPDLRHLAYERFVYDFVSRETPIRSPDEPSDELWTFIPVLYQNAAEDSCLAKVVDAVAYVNFANRYKAPQAEALAEECLGKSITLLTKIIADKKLAASTEALCSVYMMGVYENLTTLQRKGTFITHQHGANALLQLRSIEQDYKDPVSARLYEVAYAQMLLANLQAGKHPPLPIRGGVQVEDHLHNLYSNCNLLGIRLIWRVATLHATWQELKHSSNPPSSRLDLQELLQTALHLSHELQAWETTIPSSWKHTAVPNTPEARSNFDTKWQKLILGSRGAPEEIFSFPNLKRCWMWGYYRTSRIFLLRDLLEILNWMFRLPETDPLNLQMDCTDDLNNAFTGQEKPISIRLDDMTLRTHHSVATTCMVDVIEMSCSAILGSFTVQIHGKSFDDVVGMRGYVSLWPLGYMDAVLRSGLIPDSQATSTRPGPGHHSSQTSGFFEPQNLPSKAPVMMTTSPHDIPRASSNSYDTAPQFSDLSKSLLPSEQHHQSAPPGPSNNSQDTTPVSDATAKKNHIFDSSPLHPYDQPVALPALGFNTIEPKKIEVAARREWLNCMLYYIATELGIKRAIWVPMTEGFMPTVKPKVDSILESTT